LSNENEFFKINQNRLSVLYWVFSLEAAGQPVRVLPPTESFHRDTYPLHSPSFPPIFLELDMPL